MTTRARGLTALTASAALAIGAWGYAAQESARDTAAPPPATAGKDADTASGVSAKIKRGFGNTVDSMKEQFSRAKGSIQAMGVQARVYSRLHWDKALNSAAINTEVSREGMVTLRGAVADAKAKVHAVDLTRETVGVTGVTDELTIGPPAGSTTTTTTTTTTNPAPGTKP